MKFISPIINTKDETDNAKIPSHAKSEGVLDPLEDLAGQQRHVPGAVHLDGGAHGKDEEEGIFLGVLLLEFVVDAKHVRRKLLGDVKLSMGSRHAHGFQTGAVETAADDAHASDLPLGVSRLYCVHWSFGGHIQ